MGLPPTSVSAGGPLSLRAPETGRPKQSLQLNRNWGPRFNITARTWVFHLFELGFCPHRGYDRGLFIHQAPTLLPRGSPIPQNLDIWEEVEKPCSLILKSKCELRRALIQRTRQMFLRRVGLWCFFSFGNQLFVMNLLCVHPHSPGTYCVPPHPNIAVQGWGRCSKWNKSSSLATGYSN